MDDLQLKLIICGVGETLESLFSAHLSTYRYFHSIKLDRLDLNSCYAIIQKAAEALDVTLDETTMWRISRISDGFPHFVHLICEKVFWSMFNDNQRDWLALGQIELSHYRHGAQAAVTAANEELWKGNEAAVRNTSPSAEARGVELYPDHPLEKKNMPALQTTHGLVEFLVTNQAERKR